MKPLHKILEKAAQIEKYRGRHDGDIIIEEFDETPRFSAMTHMRDNSILEKYNPDYEKDNPGKTKTAVQDITRHEINHHKYGRCIGCPQTLEKHVEFFHEPMSEVLSKKGFKSSDVHYASNALEDTLLHLDLHRNENFALDGIKDFFAEVGKYTQKNKQGKHKFTKFYEAHVKLNMRLWGNSQQKKAIQKYYAHDKKVTEVLKAFTERTSAYPYLDESNWKKISQIYAEEFSKLMEPGYGLPIFNHSGKGTKGREEKSKDGKESEQREGNVFDKQMHTKDYKKERMKKANNLNQKTPGWIDKYEGLDLLYESLAQRLDIKSKTYTESEQMPISWYGKRAFDPQKDNLKHIGFGFDDAGNISLRKKRFHEDLPIEIKCKPQGFPRMRYGMLDTSQSMEDDVNGGTNVGKQNIIPWGDKSKYHYALLGWYGFLEYLKSNHLLIQNSVDLANFSSNTHIGRGITEAKRVALRPQFGRTYIDNDKIKYFFEGKDNLIFTISDGEIMNWSSINKNFIENAKKHQYFHIQIGEDSIATKQMRDAGLYVFKVMGDEDLAQKVIDLTDKMFRNT